jgi:DNA replication protein DnaC
MPTHRDWRNGACDIFQGTAKPVWEYLLVVIMRLHENRFTHMTSNRPLEDRGKLLHDVPTTTAILERLLHHARVITFNGKSYLLKNTAVVQCSV